MKTTFTHKGQTYQRITAKALAKELNKGKRIQGVYVAQKTENFRRTKNWELTAPFDFTSPTQIDHLSRCFNFYMESKLGTGIEFYQQIKE